MNQPENIFDALAMAQRLREFCAAKLALGMGATVKPADQGVAMCMAQEDFLYEQAAAALRYRPRLPSKQEFCP